MKAFTVVLAPALISLFACGPKTQFTTTGPAPVAMQPRAPDDVEVYSASLPTRDFAEVGIIQATERLGANTLSEMIASMRSLAAKKGCHALKLGGSVDRVQSTGFVLEGTGASNTTTTKGYWATCLIYTPAEMASR